ncbi:O-antigen ligase family protein [Candidatus Saccharibacteria bacterium]|nr:O-antigen ligase family protein [Candidatus Saccharibacteria bacterium]
MSRKAYPEKNNQSILIKGRLFLLYSLPVVLFCSYYPVIPIASTSSTNYELSLPLIWLLLFSILSLKDFLNTIHDIYNKRRRLLLLLLFPLYLSATAFWSTNPIRAIMTAGILWCLIITSVTLLKTFAPTKLFDKVKFLKTFLISTTAFCAICWIQSIFDCLEVDRSITLLCPGCTSYSFGFPHPSGFAIEPQFMGNLLLTPTLTVLYLWAKSKSDRDSESIFDSKTLLCMSFLFCSTLFLTFSRGAIYAFIIAFIALLIFAVVKLHNKVFWRTLPILLISFIFTLCMQGLFSEISYTDSNFASGVDRSISQLSLGKINLGLYESNNDETADGVPDTPVFDGYVEESTNTRMKFNQIALELSPKTPTSLIFGYGLGSAGEIMYQEGKTTTPFEIIQNEYLSLLLETGLLGLVLATFFIATILTGLKKLTRPDRCLLICVVLSFLISLLFFSGLPNATHAYLFPVFLAASLPYLRPNHRLSQTTSRK